MKLTATVGNYSPTTHEFDTDSPHEALRKLANVFETYEGTRNPWPTAESGGPNTLLVEFAP